MNFDLTKKYFDNRPQKPESKPKLVLPIVLGVIAAMMLMGGGGGIVLALILGAVAALIIVLRIKKGKKALKNWEDEMKKFPSDEAYDKEVFSNMSDLKERALNALGLDEDEIKEIAPISFGGYVYDGADKYREGDDGIYRTNRYEAVMLLFSKNEIHCYTYRFDTTMNKTTDATDVYFYKDVVSVSTSSDSFKFGEDVSIERTFFKLTTTGGTALSVSLFDKKGSQESINAMRALLKEKKS